MLTTTVFDFRKDIKSYIDKVVNNFEAIILNCGKNSGIVVMPLQEYKALISTNHVLSSRKKELRIDYAIN